MRDTERERQRHRQKEKQAPCRDPDVGLDPGTPGSRPEPKADTQPLSHPSTPRRKIFLKRQFKGVILGVVRHRVHILILIYTLFAVRRK